MTECAIEVRHLTKHFGNKVAVDDVSLRLPAGEVWGFLGPNGSGKTTTIRMICGLLRPTGGEGQCLGYDILRDAEAIKRRTGYMTQKFSFWGDLSIRENLEFVARLYQLPQRRAVVDSVLKQLGLTDRQHQLAEALSGGWKQRLALAAVTLHQPDLLLLDEPTAGVDPQARREFWDEIHRLASTGVTVLVSTHYMDEAERCDQIAYLAHGRLLTQGAVVDVIARSQLQTFRTHDPAARQALTRLQALPQVRHIGYFGAALQVSGYAAANLRAVLIAALPGVQWEAVDTSLEDVFIELMQQAGADQRQR